MHQSRMFSIQLKYDFSNRSGTKRMSPFFTASSAGAVNGFMSTNHCLDTIDSIVVWQR